MGAVEQSPGGLLRVAPFVGSCSTSGFAPGFDPFDVGAGLALAPQS